MKRNERFPISSLLLGRARLIEIVITVLFIGFGISLTASSLSLLDKFNPIIGLYSGLLICVTCTLFMGYRIFNIKGESYTYKAFFIVDENENEIIDIEGYEFTESLLDYLRTAFAENKALEYIWNTEPLMRQDELETPKPRSMDLIREATEYYLLDILSTHLTDYFCYPAKERKNITILQRDNIPDILLKNRFLELFSKPMEEREPFIGIDETIEEDAEPYILEVDGATYRKFEMVLPSKSTIEIANNEISIKTKRFTLNFKVDFDGANTVVPFEFMEYYLGISGFDEIIANAIYDLKVEATVQFKAFSVFSPSGWDDYNWIDSFLSKLEGNLSMEKFFKRINWDTVYPILKCIETKMKAK